MRTIALSASCDCARRARSRRRRRDSSGCSATSGSRLLSSIRSGASVCHERAFSSCRAAPGSPRGRRRAPRPSRRARRSRSPPARSRCRLRGRRSPPAPRRRSDEERAADHRPPRLAAGQAATTITSRHDAVDDRRVAVRMGRDGPTAPRSARVISELPASASTAATAAVADRVRDALDVGRERRSSRSRADSVRTSRGPRDPGPGSSGARNSTACAPASSSIASARSAFASTCQRLQAGGVPHRDVILLPGARRDRVDARRMASDLVLGDERRGHVLRDHEARVEPALARSRNGGRPSERLGLTSRSTRRSEMLASSATAIASASSANATGWPWKLPFETISSLLDEDERVVGRRVELDRDRVARRSRAGRGSRRAPAARSAASRRPAPCRTSGATR